jgi:endoglucanase
MLKYSAMKLVPDGSYRVTLLVLLCFCLRVSFATFLLGEHRALAHAEPEREYSITYIAEEIYIRINQAGYLPDDPKIAHAQARAPVPAAFSIINRATGELTFQGQTKTIAGRWGEFENHAELNFSAFTKPGTYFIRIGERNSPDFQIGKEVYAALPDELLEFMRQQRCGYNPWVDAVCHPYDGRTVYGPMPAGSYVNASGGWHDAGDQLKYLLTASNATAQLLLAYVLASQSPKDKPASSKGRPPFVFGDKFNRPGQPGANGIADVLDEARWGIDWLLKLHPAPAQLYHQVADDRDHRGFRLPQNETVDYGWGAGSYRPVYFADGAPQGLREFKSQSNGVANLAGRYAAAMALGYQVWKDNPNLRSYAARLLQAGREVYALGQSREGVQQGNSYGAPYRYEETTWADDMEWGAAELFRATGETRYLNDAKLYATLAAAESWMGREQTGHYQYYPFMNVGHFRLYDLVDRGVRNKLANYYRDGIERCLRASANNPYGVGVPFIWCSNNLLVALVTQSLLYERMTGDRRFHEFAVEQRDWLLGRNPWGISMFTEIPANGSFPRDVHLFPNAILKRSVRGGLVDGPVYRRIFQTLKGVEITQPDPLAAFQDERAVYHDDIKDYSTNEPTMDGTAAAVLMWVLQR